MKTGKVKELEKYFYTFLKTGFIFSAIPKELILCWGHLKPSKSFSQDRLSLYCPDFYLNNPKPWLIPEHSLVMSRNQFRKFLSHYQDPPCQIKWDKPDRHFFQEDFKNIKKKIRSGQLDKIVPITMELGHSDTGENFRLHLLQHSMEASDINKIYGLWKNNEGIMGVTPELLFFKMKKNRIFTMALAGTLPKNSHAKEGLKDPKLLHEHNVVIEGIRQAFANLGDLTTKKTKLMEFPNLVHLETDINIQTSQDMDLEEIVKRIHPTPALGMLPKRPKLDDLKDLHYQNERDRFGAPFGIRWPQGISECVVAIRNIQWKKNQIKLMAGCGIVSESNFYSEWKELKIKRESVKQMLDL